LSARVNVTFKLTSAGKAGETAIEYRLAVAWAGIAHGARCFVDGRDYLRSLGAHENQATVLGHIWLHNPAE
jgi:hypothetical protein